MSCTFYSSVLILPIIITVAHTINDNKGNQAKDPRNIVRLRTSVTVSYCYIINYAKT